MAGLKLRATLNQPMTQTEPAEPEIKFDSNDPYFKKN